MFVCFPLGNWPKWLVSVLVCFDLGNLIALASCVEIFWVTHFLLLFLHVGHVDMILCIQIITGVNFLNPNQFEVWRCLFPIHFMLKPTANGPWYLLNNSFTMRFLNVELLPCSNICHIDVHVMYSCFISFGWASIHHRHCNRENGSELHQLPTTPSAMHKTLKDVLLALLGFLFEIN